MRATQVVGVAFILVGLLLAFNVFPMATVIFPEKFWYKLYPDGTSGSPTLISPGSTITLTAQLVYYDVQLGINLPGTYLTWIVQVDINGQVVTLDGKDVISPVEGRYATFLFEKQWTVPSGVGVVYTLTWTAIVRDNNCNEVGRATTTTYAKTADVEPDGVFYINDKDASQTTTHIVLNPTLSLKFTATKNGDKISSVYVEVWKGGTKVSTVTLTGANPTWTASYTLPGPGTYTLKGYYTWTGSSTPIQKMSIIANWEQGELPTPWPFSITQIAGVGLIIVGAVLAFKKRW